MNWFKNVFGFDEFTNDFQRTKAMFQYDDQSKVLTSLTNKRKFHVGKFELINVQTIRERVQQQNPDSSSEPNNKIQMKLQQLCDYSVGTLHQQCKPHVSVFQVASQFNVLEMVGPSVSPEKGITIYAMDRTQGPICALAAPAGTLYRNYFINNGKGQQGINQVNTLDDIEEYVSKQTKKSYWNVKNGYALPLNDSSMKEFNEKVLLLDGKTQSNDEQSTTASSDSSSNESIKDQIISKLKIGVHWDVEVEMSQSSLKTIEKKYGAKKQIVCQVFCSACPVSYTKYTKSEDWAPFASLVLDATYEATFGVASLLARERKERVTLYLTYVGGGVFGNRMDWINRAILRAMKRYKNEPIDVCMVHYRSNVPQHAAILEQKWNKFVSKA